MNLADLFADHPWSLYLLAFIGPFVQEDAAVIGAATSAATGQGDAAGVFAATWIGVIISDGWKYWAGRLAHRWPWAAKMAANPRVVDAREKVMRRLGITLIVARFVPGTRIPLNVACGVFRVPFMTYLVIISVSAAMYLGVAYAVVYMLGAALGEQLTVIMPAVVIALVVGILGYSWWRSRLRRATQPAQPTSAGVEAADVIVDRTAP
jgi:membrane protein DedA with SNARE-associated domain